ncbi:uncharacterized protein, partial [Phyllobates terribilis]|uniref:uncharacterized protein n=1 Tax=Phyllobates terribilis TaxID=111132 RepID=UPI003CCAC5CE
LTLRTIVRLHLSSLSTDTFAYDETTSNSILALVTNSNEFLKTPSEEVRSRDYERERRRLVSYDLHSITLAEYHKQGRISRGLRSHLRPTLFSDNQDYCDKFKKILNKCSLDIIVLTIDFLQRAIKESEKTVSAIESQLTANLSSTDWSNLKSRIDKVILEHERTLQERKRQKFQRDSEDYINNRVYRWNASSGTFTRRPYQGHRNQGSFSSGSDSSTTQNEQPFLWQNRRGGRPRADRQGDRGRGERMTTRSQVRRPIW